MTGDPLAPVHRRRAPNRRADVSPAERGELTFEGAVDLFLYAESRNEGTRANIRHNLLNSHLTAFRQRRGMRTLRQFTAEAAVDYLTEYRQVRGGAHSTTEKIRHHLRQLAVWAREQQGYDGLDRPPLTTFRVPDLRQDSPPSKDDEEEEPALSRAEAERLLDAALQPAGRARQTGVAARDHLIVKLLLYCGLRPSELVGLDIRHVRLDTRPPQLEIRRPTHHRSRRRRHGDTDGLKTAAAVREVPLNISRGANLVAEMRRYLERDRPRDAASTTLFCSVRRDAAGARSGLTIDGLEEILDRLGRATGIHCNAYRFRHTCATWLVDAGIQEQYLMHIMGWDDPAMVARYFRGHRNPAILEAVAGILA